MGVGELEQPQEGEEKKKSKWASGNPFARDLAPTEKCGTGEWEGFSYH